MHANVLVAASAMSVVASTALLADRPVPLSAALAAFAASFAVYNFDRIADATDDDGTTSPQRAALGRRLRKPLVVAIALACLVTVGTASVSGWGGAAWLLAFPLAGVLYVFPVFAGRRLKDVPYLESAYVPACWCTVIGQAARLGAFAVDSALAVFSGFSFVRAFAFSRHHSTPSSRSSSTISRSSRTRRSCGSCSYDCEEPQPSSQHPSVGLRTTTRPPPDTSGR